MNRQTWTLIKQSKNFNIAVYRIGLAALIGSLVLSCLWMVLIAYFYLNQPMNDFYASNGEAPPIQLKPLPEPNASSEALLPPDPPPETVVKAIPQ